MAREDLPVYHIKALLTSFYKANVWKQVLRLVLSELSFLEQHLCARDIKDMGIGPEYRHEQLCQHPDSDRPGFACATFAVPQTMTSPCRAHA